AFAHIGLARGERVMLVLDPDDLDDAATVVRVDAGTGVVADAHEDGHLVVARNTPTHFPDGRFDADRRRAAYLAATRRAVDDGHRALRVAVSMAWAPRAGWSGRGAGGVGGVGRAPVPVGAVRGAVLVRPGAVQRAPAGGRAGD